MSHQNNFYCKLDQETPGRNHPKYEDNNNSSEKKHYGYLAGYPYEGRPTGMYYVLHRKGHQKKLWKKVTKPHKRFHSITKDKVIGQVMFWANWLFSLSALVVSFIKEEYEEEAIKDGGKDEEEIILDLTVVELVLALIAVFLSLLKNYLVYGHIIRQENAIDHHDVNTPLKAKRKKKTLAFCAFALWIVAVVVIISMFVYLHTIDHEGHEDLKYTKYTTVVTLFLSLIFDAVISDMIAEASSQVQIDHCRMVIHQLKAELVDILKHNNEVDRANKIEHFVDSRKLYALPEQGYILEMNEGQCTKV